MTEQLDVVVIGGGVGGYVCAIRAAQNGLRVALVEKNKTLGGTCLNVGCIPSKALLESSELYAKAQHQFKEHGIDVGSVSLDMTRLMQRKERVVSGLTKGVEGLLRKNKIEWIKGTGCIQSANQVIVRAEDAKDRVLSTRFVVIATGSIPAPLKGIEWDGEVVVSSTEALSWSSVPKHLVVIGAGVIGLELGSVYARLGARVSVLEYQSQILPGVDAEVAQLAQRLFSKQGLEFILNARVTGAVLNKKSKQATVSFDKDAQSVTLQADKVLLCVGRRPYSEGLGLDNLGLFLEKNGTLWVNEHYQTKVPNVYAVGDMIAGPMLAHKAEEEGVACADHMAGRYAHVNYQAIPNVIYTHPEIASVGDTEEQLKAKGIAYKKGSFPFMANGRAKAMADTDGFVKILADEKTDRILGAHIVGPRAGDLIAELAVAMEFKASAEDIAMAVHAHPTLAEVIKEAALGVHGRTIHF